MNIPGHFFVAKDVHLDLFEPTLNLTEHDGDNGTFKRIIDKAAL